jgi:hypothetical protein
LFGERENLGGTNCPTKPQHQKGFAQDTAEKTGIDKSTVRASRTGADPLGFVIRKNLHRRHLNDSQRGMIGAELANLEKGDNQHSPIGETSVTRAQAAQMLSVGKRTIERAKTVRDTGTPELVERVERGDMAVSVDTAARNPVGFPWY